VKKADSLGKKDGTGAISKGSQEPKRKSCPILVSRGSSPNKGELMEYIKSGEGLFQEKRYTFE